MATETHQGLQSAGQTAELRDFTMTEQLRNGTPVTIRAIRPDDKARITAAFQQLEPETVYTRFFQHKTQLTDAELQKATELDFDKDVRLVVTMGQGERETIIGTSGYSAYQDADNQWSAEIAFTVEEDYQGQGIASRLLRQLVEIGRARGVARFKATVLPSNDAMLGVFSRSGLPMQTERDSETINVTLTLDR